jgi:hypothetical protein
LATSKRADLERAEQSGGLPDFIVAKFEAYAAASSSTTHCGLVPGTAALVALRLTPYVDQMDPKSTGFLAAPGASGPALRLPGMHDQQAMPRLDEHLVREGTREEMLRGQRLIAAPAREPHADPHARLDYLITAAAASGYVTSSDLLTRAGPGSEFATDTSVRREGIDPATNTRYLEELAFEVVSTQSLREITLRAEDLSNRGVRRVIAVFVKKREVAEWSASTKSWLPLALDSKLADPTLARPVSIRAVFDAGVADNEVIESLAAKGNPQLAEREAAKHEQGLAQGLARGQEQGQEQGLGQGLLKAVESVCEVLGIALGTAELTHVQALDAAGLESLLDEIKAHRRWPARL